MFSNHFVVGALAGLIISVVGLTFAVIRKVSFEQFCSVYPSTALKIYRAIIRTMAERLQDRLASASCDDTDSAGMTARN